MTPRFGTGDRVRVRAAFPPGHVRTPHYVRGRSGVVDGIAGSYRNPEELAYGRSGEPAQTLYRVRFAMAELWRDAAEAGEDSTVVDIFDSWLEPAEDTAP